MMTTRQTDQADRIAEAAMDEKRHAILTAAFDLVKNPEHWKDPIEATIPEDMFDITKLAVMYFTATRLVMVEQPHGGYVRVKAAGYRAGPAGDH